MSTQISAEKVKELREKSGAGIMDCKRALAATEGELERAIEFLRKEGTVKAARKAGRTTLEGLIGIGFSPDRAWASLVEVNCETDFVARTDPFQEFVRTVAGEIVRERPADLAGLIGVRMEKVSLEEALSQLIARLGENMAIRRFRLVGAAEGEKVGSYLHAGSKIGVLVRVRGVGTAEGEVVRDIAMHVAAMAPRYLDRGHVPREVVLQEREIALAAPEIAAKPEVIREKIVEGKLARFYSEACLLEQPFIKDPTGKRTVGEHLPKGAGIVETVRFQVGEEFR